jgi:meckelin
VPLYVRWASNIKFKVTLDPATPEHIYTPWLEITYRERASNLIHEGSTTSVSFVMDYYQDMTQFWKSIMIAFIIFQVIIALVIAFRLYYFVKQNPRSLLKEKFSGVLLQRIIYLFFDVWSGIMFWVIFFTAAYWFLTFKLSSAAFVLLPSIDDWGTAYLVFDTVFGLVLAFRFLAIVMAIFEQSSVDIFLIDWEQQPAPHLVKPSPYPKDNIVVWRSVFVANELNELQQDYRYVRPEATLLWFVFFIKALGWEELA